MLVLGSLAVVGRAAGAVTAVTGTITSTAEATLSPNAVAVVTLVDQTATAEAGAVIGEQRIEPAGALPLAFQVPYDDARIDPTHSYALLAAIVDGDAEWETPIPVPVITGGPSVNVEVTVEPAARSSPARSPERSPRPTAAELSDDAVMTAVLIKEETGTLVSIDTVLDVTGADSVDFALEYESELVDPTAQLHRPRRDRGRRDRLRHGRAGRRDRGRRRGRDAAEPRDGRAARGGPGSERRAVAERRARASSRAQQPSRGAEPRSRPNRPPRHAGATPAPTPTRPPTAHADADADPDPAPTPTPDARPRRRPRRRPDADADSNPNADPDAHADAHPDADAEPVAVAVAVASPSPSPSAVPTPTPTPTPTPRSGVLSGTLTYNEPAPLSAEARALVVLVEGAGRPTAGSIVASTLLTEFSQVPIPFELPYSQRAHRPQHHVHGRRGDRGRRPRLDVRQRHAGDHEGQPEQRRRPRPHLPTRPRQGRVTGQISGVDIELTATAFSAAVIVDLDSDTSVGLDVNLDPISVPIAFSVPFDPAEIDQDRELRRDGRDRRRDQQVGQ